MGTLEHWRAYLALLRLFRAEKPDMVHAHMPISGFLARIAAWWAGVPHVVCTCHGFWFNSRGNSISRVIVFLMEWIAGQATHVFLAVSRTEAIDARRTGIHRHAVAVGNGRNPAMFHPDPITRVRLRSEIGAGTDRVAVVAVSRLVREKGYNELAAAMRDIPGAELWVVGERLESDRGQDVAEMLRGSNLDSRLRLLGYRNDVAAVLMAADIFVLPSYFEGLPMSVIEAMLTGLPVVATDISGPREQVVNEITGLLVPPRTVNPLADALRRLADNPAARAEMGAAGRARALELYDEAKVLGWTLDLMGVEDSFVGDGDGSPR
jgi:glycosyltransferase involved in cell wall biosynthesis